MMFDGGGPSLDMYGNPNGGGGFTWIFLIVALGLFAGVAIQGLVH